MVSDTVSPEEQDIEVSTGSPELGELYVDENGDVPGLYDPDAPGHDACGVTVMASLDGESSHEIIQMVLEALENMQHRAGLDADGVTGDGVGVKAELPQEMFKELYNEAQGQGEDLDPQDESQILGVGQLYLPRNDRHAKQQCLDIIDEALGEEIFDEFRNWR